MWIALDRIHARTDGRSSVRGVQTAGLEELAGDAGTRGGVDEERRVDVACIDSEICTIPRAAANQTNKEVEHIRLILHRHSYRKPSL